MNKLLLLLGLTIAVGCGSGSGNDAEDGTASPPSHVPAPPRREPIFDEEEQSTTPSNPCESFTARYERIVVDGVLMEIPIFVACDPGYVYFGCPSPILKGRGLNARP